MDNENILRIAFLNIKGQTGLNKAKQVQIEDFMKTNRIDIMNLQESNIEDKTFSDCKYIFLRVLISLSTTVRINTEQLV